MWRLASAAQPTLAWCLRVLVLLVAGYQGAQSANLEVFAQNRMRQEKRVFNSSVVARSFLQQLQVGPRSQPALVLDIGANRGDWGRELMRLCAKTAPHRRVDLFLFEPQTRFKKEHAKIVKQWGDCCVHPIPAIAWTTETNLTLHVPRDSRAASVHAGGGGGHDYTKGLEEGLPDAETGPDEVKKLVYARKRRTTGSFEVGEDGSVRESTPSKRESKVLKQFASQIIRNYIRKKQPVPGTPDTPPML